MLQKIYIQHISQWNRLSCHSNVANVIEQMILSLLLLWFKHLMLFINTIKVQYSTEQSSTIVFSKCLLHHGVVHDLCRLCVSFLYGPFRHGALKLDISTLFTAFFLWTSLYIILKKGHCSRIHTFCCLNIQSEAFMDTNQKHGWCGVHLFKFKISNTHLIL